MPVSDTVTTRTWSPTLNPVTSAECLSMTISSAAVGARPATRCIGLRSALDLHAKANGGAWPLMLSPLPCLSTITPVPEMLKSASLTPGTARTVSIRLASIRSRCWVPCASLNVAWPRTSAATDPFTLTTRLLNVRVIVSDSTSVPAMNATPSTIATEIIRIRSFRAAMPLRVTFHMADAPGEDDPWAGPGLALDGPGRGGQRPPLRTISTPRLTLRSTFLVMSRT